MKRRERIRLRHSAVRRRPERRGVLLLVVLSMLVLFLLLGTTFLLTSGQYRTAAKIVEKSHRTTFQPADLLERALMQLVRDTNNAGSVIRHHSLLRDLYGVEGFAAKVYAASPNLTQPQPTRNFPALPRYAGVDQTGSVNSAATGFGRGATQGQIVELYVQDVRENRLGAGATMADGNAVGLDLDSNGLPTEHELSTVGGYYEGCLLTMLAGPCRGQSVRIVGYDPLFRHVNPGVDRNSPDDDIITVAARLRVLAPRRVDGKPLQFLHPTDAGGVRLVDFSENANGHAFIVNGRPFSGAGVGLNPLAMSSHLPEQPSARLSMLELVQGATNYAVEVALAPNSVHFNRDNILRQPVSADGTMFTRLGMPAMYPGFAGLGGSNESYDAPDYQNMALAMQPLEPRLRGRVVNSAGASVDPDVYYPNPTNAASQPAPAYLDLDGVTIPSFHRPDLANFWFHRLMNADAFWGSASTDPTVLSQRVRAILEPYNPAFGLTPQQAAQITALKRKFLLRPLREDHPDFDGSNPLARYGTDALRAALNGGALVRSTTDPDTGAVSNEITFPYWEAVGPWDVDNDGDGVNDSVWVDIGLPVQQTEDGRWYKPLVAMLVEDLDGRLNLNAHGSEADMAQAGLDASNDGSRTVGANLAMDSALLQQAVNNPNTPINYTWLRSSDQLPGGVGWGVAETSLRSVLLPTLPLSVETARIAGTLNEPNNPPYDISYIGNPQYDDYARILVGRPDPSAAGRNAAVALRESVAFGRIGSLPGSTASLPLIKPGRTFVTDPAVIASVPVFNTMRDVRTPYDFTGTPLYTAAEHRNTYEALSGFSSAPDLGGRYAAGLSGSGASVDEPRSAANVRSFPLGRTNNPLTWRELSSSAPDDSPYELDLSVGARNRPPASLDDVRSSYDPNLTGMIQPQATPISDDAPFSAAELERVLRAFDGDAQKLPDRLWKAVDAFDPAKKAAANMLNAHLQSTGSVNSEPTATPNSLQLVVAGAEAAVTRRQVTTDSWDLPVPNENLYDRLLLGADGAPGVPLYPPIGSWVATITLPANDDGDGIGIPGVDDDNDGTVDESDDLPLFDEGDEAIVSFDPSGIHTFIRIEGGASIPTQRNYQDLFNAGCDDYVVVMRKDPPKSGRLTDYLKYRITLEMLRNGRLAVPPAVLTPAQLATYHADIDRLTSPVLFGEVPLPPIPPGFYSFGGLIAPELLAGRRMDLNRPFGDGRDNNNNGVVDETEEAGEPFADLNNNGRYDTNEPYIDRDLNGAYTASRDKVWIDTDGDGVEEELPFRHIPLHETFVDRNGVRIYNPQMARQLFARHLYCLMLALMDDNYLAPYDAEDMQSRHYIDPLSGYDNGVMAADASEACRIANELHGLEFGLVPPSPTGTTPVAGVSNNHTLPLTDAALEKRRLQVLNRARQMAMRKLTCRRIAQWAINVVDYRDPDSIQTAFEYDENPWDGWNVVDVRHNRTYPLDGDLATDENRTMVRPTNRTTTNTNPLQPTWSAPQREFYVAAGGGGQFREVGLAPSEYAPGVGGQFLPDEMLRLHQTRGVVWGGERPEVLLTEGVAWHDRRLEDLESVTKANIQGAATQPPRDGYKVDGPSSPESHRDDDLDQLRKPKGFAYLEAYNPHVGDDQRPAELYSSVDISGNAAASVGVRLDRLSNQAHRDLQTGVESRSPVWRIAVVEEHPLIRNATLNGTNVVGQASDDPITAATATNKTYLSDTIDNGPWLYESDLAPGAIKATMPHAYLDYYQDKTVELGYALATTEPFIIGNQIVDADNIGVSAGVIERAPTIPDTSFPAFDPFAQPHTPTKKDVSISSKSDAADGSGAWPGQGFVTRGVLRKPNTFMERVFYLAPAPVLAPNAYDGSEPAWPTANLTAPGLRVPLLTYSAPSNYAASARNTILQVGKSVGAIPKRDDSLGGMLEVYVSKFANAYNRFATTSTERTQVIPLAPLMPGRRAVIGTTGDTYGFNLNSVAPTAQEMQYPFEGPVAERMNRRYAAVISQNERTASGTEEMGPGADTNASVFRGLRRFEMAPDPNPNRHQFAIRMNGLNESLSVLDTNNAGPFNGNAPFNVTGGAGSGVSTGTTPNIDVNQDTLGDPRLSAAPPVIAIPIDHFSISEPLDEYLVRQIELDSGLTYWWKPGFTRRPAGQGRPHEDYFTINQGSFDPKHFDEPFDILPELIENQTTPNYRSVHLERLANPLLPWNPPPLRPDGQAIAQHDPRLPVNPYLPVDSRALDLTAFNSMSDLERLVPGDRGHAVAASDLVNANTPPRGPEERHRSKRELAKVLNMNSGDASNRTVIGFASNERERPQGPFPLMWMMEPARLLWRQSGPSTFSEIAHTYAKINHNGYLARSRDQILEGATPLGREGTAHDGRQIGSTVDPSVVTDYSNDQFVDVAWRVTLGFSDWMSGEFHTGQALSWWNDAGATDGAMEGIDLDGDRFGGDLPGRPEINTAPNTQSLAANGKTAAINGATVSGNNARDFMQTYLQAQAAEQGTTPEFAWPNRPLASAGELLQVPAWGGSRMLTYYSVFNWQYTQNPHFSRRTQVNPYDGEAEVPHDGLDYNPDAGSAAAVFDGNFANEDPSLDTIIDIISGVQRPNSESTNVVRFRDMLGHFGHLMNFFQTARFSASVNSYAHQTKNGVAEAAVPRGAAHHYRLLDYVCVPSRFTATDTILNLDAFSDAGMAINDPRQELAAPFNRVDNYREPGRVNLNTIVGRRNPAQPRDHWSEVYDGLMQRLHDDSVIASGSLIKQGHLGPAWRDVALSRRGYVQSRFNPTLVPTFDNTSLAADGQNQVDYSPMRMHPDFPTLFANPFRAPGEGANVPLANMVQTGVDATMLRAHPLSPGADGAWGKRGVTNTPAFIGGQDNFNRNDASEAGTLPIQVGGGSMPVPTQAPIDRLPADTVLARFQSAAGVRGRIPDTFLEDAFRPSPVSINPREVSPRQSSLLDPIPSLPPENQPPNPVSNSEVAKRSTPVPLFSGASLEPSIDTERNSTQRYLPIQRMANLATTRSNVYAVWITVGFFEVKQVTAESQPAIWTRYRMNEPAVPNPTTDAERALASLHQLFFRVYPDGWTLDEEIGRATGEDVRHRGFYVVDRSRPVAFKPGEDANVSETVLVRRRIQ